MNTTNSKMEVFEDITILSLEQATTLPYLTYRLAQDGMNVIRVEHPIYGDPNRMVGENYLKEERMNTYYLCINAGKKAITLNLAEKGKDILKELIMNISHLRCGPVGVRFIEPAMTGVINALAQT